MPTREVVSTLANNAAAPSVAADMKDGTATRHQLVRDLRSGTDENSGLGM
jgi:hypothetical protein